MKIEISVSGCDDTTRITMDVTDEQHQFLHRVAEEVTAASSYQCMPTMEVRLAPIPEADGFYINGVEIVGRWTDEEPGVSMGVSTEAPAPERP